MKKFLPTLALAALAAGTIFAASPAHAVSYYDTYGRAYYYNSWGQPVYYDTGYNNRSYNGGSSYSDSAARYSDSSSSQRYQRDSNYAPAQPVYSYSNQSGYSQNAVYGGPADMNAAGSTGEGYYESSPPQMAATPYPTAYAPTYPPLGNSSQTTYQYYYPDGSSASNTYVSQTGPAPMMQDSNYSRGSNYSRACRQSSHTAQQWGDMQTRYTTECQQPDGSWMEQ